ncbi:MAG: T9SS C-terminal target domain-containing protein [Bacteroidetes bacterium]|nr:T9SS C-terminal target domain-containing protein [Bacteroidota bacterium]
MKQILVIVLIYFINYPLYGQKLKSSNEPKSNPPIYIAFLWHMHQPIYWPGENIIETQLKNYYPYSIFDIHNQRIGPYTNWPSTAIQKGIDAGLEHVGASVSFSGTLIENLNQLESIGNSNFSNWTSYWKNAAHQKTLLGNSRIDLIGFGYYHPLMGLLSYEDIRAQIQKHKTIMHNTFGVDYSKGLFPPENAFSVDMIPALQDEGVEWVLVDNIHFERASQNYPYTTNGNLIEPNKADLRNPNPNDWVQLKNVWAPTKVSAQWAHLPHYVEYTDPQSGKKSKIIAVPTDRYLGNEDGRGGFGALQYEQVMSQIESYNTDPDHPILIVLHHDGDNYGGGSESYYNSNFQSFINWAKDNPNRFVPTTIQDYLDQFPPKENDVIHVESGSWAGADNGDPEFKKWLGDPDQSGYSPDRNSWAVVTAANNYVQQASSIDPNHSNVLESKQLLLNAQASDYWYWDNSIDGIWDTHPTTASNIAIEKANSVIVDSDNNDIVPPTIFKPQREPYNPGGMEWGTIQPSNFTVWTYAFDVSGLKTITLKYRVIGTNFDDRSMIYPISTPELSSWQTLSMDEKDIPPKSNINPIAKAKEYSATISDYNNTYIEYYVEGIDNYNNISKSIIQYVWVGESNNEGVNNSGSNSTTLSIYPENPTRNDTITIALNNTSLFANLHWGVNNNGSNWNTPNTIYWPEHTILFNNIGPAVESPFNFNQDSSVLNISIGPLNSKEQKVDRLAFVIHYENDTWDNNKGNDYIINFDNQDTSSQTISPFMLDGDLDSDAKLVSSNEDLELFISWKTPYLYVATESAAKSNYDKFIFITDTLSNLISSPWAKAGQVFRWSHYLANEQSNNYQTWSRNSEYLQSSAGSYLEGVINIEKEFGIIPKTLYLNVSEYESQDGGVLINQLPNGNKDGNIDSNEFFSFDYSTTTTNEWPSYPSDFILYQNYPNPFNPSTQLYYTISERSHIQLSIFNSLGQKIFTLVDKPQNPGTYSVTFNGSHLSSGIYYYQIKSSNFSKTRKMILLK